MGTTLGLRERKKLESRRALAAAARSLALQRGLNGFTIDDVAEAANVSPRTFFNYFDSKESAVIGADDESARDLHARLVARPAGEPPLTALRNLFFSKTDDLGAAASRWVDRIELVGRHPELMPRHLAAMNTLELELSEAMAERLGLDHAADPYPTVLVAAVINVVRSTMAWWHSNGRPDDLADHLDTAFARLAKGLAKPTIPPRATPRRASSECTS